MILSRSILTAIFALVAGLSLAVARPAQAQTDFTFTLSNPTQVVAPGGSGSFNGTVTFPSPVTITFFDKGFSLFSTADTTSRGFDPSLTSFFFTGTGTYTGAIYDFTLAATDTPGQSITGNLSLGDASGKISNPISLTVGAAPVPEASTTVSFGLLLALGLGGTVVAAKKRQTAPFA